MNDERLIKEEIQCLYERIGANEKLNEELKKRLHFLQKTIERVYFDPETHFEYYAHSMSAKVKIGGSWYDAVLYTKENDTTIYVRTLSDFLEKFEKK